MKKPNKDLKLLSLLLQAETIELITWMSAKPVKDFSNEEILNGILNENREVFQFIRLKTFPQLLSLVKRNEGNFHVAEELFQDALIVIFKKLKKGPIPLQVKFGTYFLGICKTIWKFNHKNNSLIVLDSVDIIDDEKEIEDIYQESKEFQLYRKHFNQLKKRQQKILMASLSNKTYNDLFEQFGFKNANVLKTEISRIKKRLIENITSDPDFKKYNGGKNWNL